MTALNRLYPISQSQEVLPNPNNHIVKWIYSSNYTGPQTLIDPRIPVARHLAWTKSSTPYTEYSIPEPENYNRAIFTTKPIELTWIRDQVIYKDAYRNGWITLCFLPESQVKKFDDWVLLMDMTYWRHIKPGNIKIHKPMLQRGASVNDMSLDERLLTMGHYKNLVVKYFDGDPQYVRSRLGEARANLTDLIKDD